MTPTIRRPIEGRTISVVGDVNRFLATGEELVRKSGLPASALIEVGTDHRLADPEPLAAMLEAYEPRRQQDMS